MQPAQFLRRKAAAQYLREKFGFGSERSLAKYAVVGGGPPFRKAGESIVLYEPSALDAWALNQIGEAQTSTSAGASPNAASRSGAQRGRPPKAAAVSRRVG